MTRVTIERTRFIERLFPREIDNVYRALRPGLWLFALVVALKAIIGTNSILNSRAVATGADGIPLDRLGPTAEPIIISLFALLNVGQLVLALFGVLVLLRYRAMVPIAFLLFLFDHLARKSVAWLHPFETEAEGPGFSINLALLAIMLIGLTLSLATRPKTEKGARRPPPY